MTKKYSNGEVTIIWKPDLCIHSGICVGGLPEVFNTQRRPWIEPTAASTEKLIQQVQKCPSGALSFEMNEPKEVEGEVTSSEVIAEVTPNGPLLIYGNITVKKTNGETEKKSRVTALCRCGQSSTKPYCDGTHRKVGFQG